MTFENTLARVAHALERAQVPYMVTGSVASSAHGGRRPTSDIARHCTEATQVWELMRQPRAGQYALTSSKPGTDQDSQGRESVTGGVKIAATET